MNFEIRTIFSNSDYLSTDNEISCFKTTDSSNNCMKFIKWSRKLRSNSNGFR
ncbi:hypothetical protein [Clostridium cuniculi]|uniref:hypothetical protein n=1 Tax=Clostridium cuniculi TaxID=2548455 RepID=UPI001054E664